MMEHELSPLRFCGNRTNPNFPAVHHLLKTYASHLGTHLVEVEDATAEVYWDRKKMGTDGPCIVLPGREAAYPELDCDWTTEGYPVPVQSQEHRLRSLLAQDTLPQTLNAKKSSEMPIIMDQCKQLVMANTNGVLTSDWDLFSFCADILFKRADYLPQYQEASREGCYERLYDKKLKLAKQPWVDLWLFRILGHLPRLKPAIMSLPAKSRLWLTHDLDNLSKWRLRSVLGQLARTPGQISRGQLALLKRNYAEIWNRILTGRDPFETMDQIHALEGHRQSASFFLANGRDHLFHRYELSEPRYRRVLDSCLAAKKAIGLHGQVHVISNPKGIAAEVNKLAGLAGCDIYWNRQHYLRWDVNDTFSGLQAAGIKVDSTLGYNDSPGFRTGSAWPYLWFDCAKDSATQLVEVPLILAEFQFYDPLNFDGEFVRKIIREYFETTCKVGGVFTVLFHNQYFYEAEFPGHSQIYADLVSMANDRGILDFDPAQEYANLAKANGNG